MPLYEHVFLARQDLAQAQVDALAETATNIITENGGSVVKAETWGLRGLAYRIAKNRKAHYVMLDIDAPAAAVANSPAAYQPKTAHDNTPWRFDMSQNGKRMTADEFDAWMKSRGVRVVKAPGAPAAAPAPAEPAKKN